MSAIPTHRLTPAYDSAEALLMAMRDLRLTRSAVAVLAVLIDHADFTGHAPIGVGELTRATGYTYRNVQNTVQLLEQSGYVRRSVHGLGALKTEFVLLSPTGE